MGLPIDRLSSRLPRRLPYGQKSLAGLVSGRTDWTPRSGGLSSLEPRSEKNLPAEAFYFATLCIARITALYLRPLCC
jgi:hypothetical protein